MRPSIYLDNALQSQSASDLLSASLPPMQSNRNDTADSELCLLCASQGISAPEWDCTGYCRNHAVQKALWEAEQGRWEAEGQDIRGARRDGMIFWLVYFAALVLVLCGVCMEGFI